jgi:hypothetical protein
MGHASVSRIKIEKGLARGEAKGQIPGVLMFEAAKIKISPVVPAGVDAGVGTKVQLGMPCFAMI